MNSVSAVHKLINILVIEDNPDDYDLLVRALSKSGLEVSSMRIESREELIRQFEGQEWQLIISDNNLPQFNAREALSVVRERDEMIPFIIVSGTIGEEVAVDAMRSGANDYILKNNLTRLIPAVNRELQEFFRKKELGKIERELAKSQRNYKLLAENVLDLVCVHDNSCEYLWISPSVERILGYTSHEMKELGFFYGLHEEDECSVRENLDALLSRSTQTNVRRFNYRRRRKDGVFVFLETIINGIYEGSSLKKIVSTSRNITEQVLAYQLLEENEARQAGTLESLSEGIILLDENGNLITHNQSADQLLGIKKKTSADELLAAKDNIITIKNERLPPEELPYRKTLDSGIAKYNQIIGFKKSGSPLWVSMNSVPYNLSGKKKGVVISFSNVTREIENQKQRDQFAQELVSLIENANAPIFGIDWDGKITEWNRFTSEITGYKKEEVQGTSLAERLVQDSHKELVMELFQGVLHGQNAVNYELPLLTKQNKVVTILFNGTARKDYAGKIVGMVGVGQDITELIEYRGKLELKVEERTEELVRSLEKQKELVAMKSKFVSMASHEFRTPLSTIQFATDFVRKYYKRATPEKLEEKFKKINQQVKPMTYLLDDVLTIGKSQAGAIKLNPSLVEIRKFCQDIFNEIRTSSNSSHKIISSIFVETDRLYLDVKLLRNILVNLLTNAIKFSPQADKIRVDVMSKHRILTIEVQDWGNGIDEADQAQLFEAFHRGSNVGTIQGTGLGLSIVKKAVEIQSGTIKVESLLDQGSTFKIKIPVKYEEDISD
ncbi:MAG: PAS domain S-box protein [Bacteroidota bacterium]